jgi:serine/threonine protein kinase
MQLSPFTKNLSPGDAVYGAPDAVLEGRTSRPYDLWSMGCIFLELLTWMVGLEEHNVERFADERMKEVDNAHGNQDQAFWYRDIAGRVLLKPAVVTQLKVLKETCKGRGVFPELVRIVGKLLSILPSDRPEASKLFNDLDAIMIQVRRDLKNENFYVDNMPTEVRIAAPPSSVADSDDLSRRPSIDERAIIARYGDSLAPGPGANRRSTVGTVHQTAGQRRPSVHARHQSTPEADANPRYLAPLDIDTRVEPSSPTNGDEIPNTPRISLSDFDNGPARTEALLHMGFGDESLPPIGSYYANFAPGLQKTMSSDS